MRWTLEHVAFFSSTKSTHSRCREPTGSFSLCFYTHSKNGINRLEAVVVLKWCCQESCVMSGYQIWVRPPIWHPTGGALYYQHSQRGGWISGISGSCRCGPLDKMLPAKTVERRFTTNWVGLITFTDRLLRSHNLNKTQLHLRIQLLTQTCSEESNAGKLEPLATPLSSYLGPPECRHADVHGLISGGSGWPRCVTQTHSVFRLPLTQTWGSTVQRSSCLLGHINPVKSRPFQSITHKYVSIESYTFLPRNPHVESIEYVAGTMAL